MDVIVVWHGAKEGPCGSKGEMLPPRPQRRSCLPVDRDQFEDRRIRQEARTHRERRALLKPFPGEVRYCACGCRAVLPSRRKRDGKIKAGKRGSGWIRGHSSRRRAA